jgi:hypothetical protein
MSFGALWQSFGMPSHLFSHLQIAGTYKILVLSCSPY